ncbi:MAG: DUF6291 domain-containing protein [Faecousia sp.]
MEPRNQFTFYRSYWDAIEYLPPEDRHAVLEAIIPYALFGTEPALESQIARTAFILIKPTLDSGRKKAESGKKGMAIRWQPNNKPITNGYQPDNKGEKKGEKEKEIEIEIEKETEIEKEVETENEIENESYISSPLPEDGREEQEVMRFPLKDKTEYVVTAEYANQLAQEFNDLDVTRELTAMRAWLMSNPDRWKTRKGIRRFINGWLLRAREQTIRKYTHGADRLAAMIERGDFDD